TNGVQPLWAVITIGLTALLADDVALLRAMCLVSGLCWIGASVVLYRALRSYDRWLGLLVAAGFVFTGFFQRYAFQGMENGLHALFFAMLVQLGMRHLRTPERVVSNYRPGFYLKLGLLLGLITLTRVDGGLLALIIGVLVLFGFIRTDPNSRPWLNVPGAFFTALPGALLVGAFVALSHEYFGSAMPISGKVKIYLESVFEPKYGGPLGSLAWHVKFLSDIASNAYADHLNLSLFEWFHWHLPAKYPRWLVWVFALIGWTAFVVRRRHALRHVTSLMRPWHWFVTGIVAFIVLHMGTYAVVFSNFTQYCTWYFAPELMACWVLTGVSILLLGRAITPRGLVVPGCLMGLFTLVVLGSNLLFAVRPPASDARTNQFYTAAMWCNKTLPGHQTVGAFSSGILGYFATHHQVINLDGLMNDRNYLDEYLSKNRVPEYTRERGITYIADYAPVEQWRGGNFWGLLVENMQLVRWWHMPGDLRYAVWKLLPEGRDRDILSPCDGFCDRLSQVLYAAEIYGRYDMVLEQDLADYLTQPYGTNKRVLISAPDADTGVLRHVMVPEDHIAAINLTPDNIDIQQRCGIRFENALLLLGIDVPKWQLKAGRRFVITLYWQMIAEEHDLADVSFELWINPADPGLLEGVPAGQVLIDGSRGCHDTCRVQNWRPGEVVAETRSIGVPYGMPPGTYPVMLVLYDPKHGWLLPDGRVPSAAVPVVHLGNLTVE
ncbi:MAG: hypothetical protein JXO22_12410, partial [Phycisphaerae bacterium]|nr:hypothetical protein [Phycisphaerae bacterium]